VQGAEPPLGVRGRRRYGGLFPQRVQGAELPLGVRGRRTLQKLEY